MLFIVGFAFCAVLSSFFGQRFKTLREFFTITFAVLTFVSSAFATYSFLQEGLLQEVFTLQFGIISINLGFDVYGLIFINLVSLLWGIAAFYSFSYLQTNYPEKNDTSFQFCYSLSVLVAILFALARDVMTMFIFYECLTLATIALVAFKRNEESRVGVSKYLIILLGCSLLLLLPATLFTLSQTGIELFTGNGFIGNFGINETTLKILLLMFVFGVGKAALFPFHIWLPAAMCAPTPVSGLLHAVAVVKVGAFFIFRIVVDVFGIEFLSQLLAEFNFLMLIAAITIIYSSTMAVFEANLKKRLAFSTIGQISYVVLALSTFTKLGIFAAMLQIISHAIAKILLFFAVGGFYTSAHSNQIVHFTGMVQKNKVACFTFLIAVLSICGIPFTAGFLNKGVLFYNLIEAKSYFALSVLTFSAFLSFLYLIPVCYAIFKVVPAKQVEGFSKIPLKFNIVFIILALLNIMVFILGSLFFLSYVNEW